MSFEHYDTQHGISNKSSLIQVHQRLCNTLKARDAIGQNTSEYVKTLPSDHHCSWHNPVRKLLELNIAGVLVCNAQ